MEISVSGKKPLDGNNDRQRTISRREFLERGVQLTSYLFFQRLFPVFSNPETPKNPVLSPLKEGRQIEYPPIFNRVLSILIERHWNEDGNWSDDMMHDATSFAPMILYRLAQNRQLPLQERKKHQSMADKTVEYELRCLKGFLADQRKHLGEIKEVLSNANPSSPGELAVKLTELGTTMGENINLILEKGYPAISGSLALLEGLESYKGDAFKKREARNHMTAGLLLVNSLFLGINPESIQKIMEKVGFSYTTANAFVAYANFRMAEATGNRTWAQMGKILLEKNCQNCWVEKEDYGYFKHSPKKESLEEIDQGSMLMALKKAHSLFPEKKQRYNWFAEKTLRTIRARLVVKQGKGKGGILAWPKPKERLLALSGSNTVLVGSAMWGDRELATGIVDAMSVFIIPQGEKHEGLLAHHVYLDEEFPVNYACTGCNFLTLYGIHLLKTLDLKSETI